MIVRSGHNYNDTAYPLNQWVSGQATIGTIPDGTSTTLMVSEEQLNPAKYMSSDWHDDAGWADGWDPDVARYTDFEPKSAKEYPSSSWQGYRFGSAHATGLNGLFGDASVRFMKFSANPILWNNIGGRDDGQVVDLSGL